MNNDTTAEDLFRRFGMLWAFGLAEQDRLTDEDAATAAGACDIEEWVSRHRDCPQAS